VRRDLTCVCGLGEAAVYCSIELVG
jgi:hypothetical protein